MYKDIWNADIGSELPCYPESTNSEDRYAVAIMDDTHVVGHVPRKISFICHLFLCHAGVIVCRVTGPRQHSRDLIQGGLDVPCQYQFYSEDEERLKVVKKLLESASYSTDIVSNPEKFQAMKIATPVKPHNSRNEVSLTASKTGKVKKEPVETEVKRKRLLTKKTEEEPAKKRRKIDVSVNTNGRKEWLRVGGIKLRMEDRDSIIAG